MTHIAFEIEWLLLGAADVGFPGAGQTVTVCHRLGSSAETASQIRLLAELGVALFLFLVGLKLDGRPVRTLGPVAPASGRRQVALATGLR
jgi:Kef-type K+ transport system membrane component KefB